MKPRARAKRVMINIHTNAIAHSRRHGEPGVTIQKKTGRRSEHVLTIGLGKNSATARITRKITAQEFARVKQAIMEVLDEMGKRQGKKTAAQRYSMLTPGGRVRQKQWRKTYMVQKPLRISVPSEATLVVQHFDSIARESSRVERLRQWKRVSALGKNVARMVGNLFFQYNKSGRFNRFTRDVLDYINKPFITNDPEFFSFILAQIPSITAAKDILTRYRNRLGGKKYAATLQMLTEWHARQRHVPAERGTLLEFFVRKRKTNDARVNVYDFYPRPQGWADPRAAPF